MNILYKYLAKQFYLAFLFILLAFVSLFIFFDFLTEIKAVNGASYSNLLALTHVVLQVPDTFYNFSPIATLIAGVFILSKLSVNSEFVIFRTSGMKPSNLAKTLCLIGIPIVVFIFTLGEFISPLSEITSKNIRKQALGNNYSTNLKSGIWLKNDNEQQKQFIKIGQQNANQLQNIEIYKYSPQFSLQEIVYAKNVIIKNNIWTLNQVKTIKTNPNSTDIKIIHQPITQEKININPNFFSIISLKPNQVSIVDLYRHIKYLNINKQNSFEYKLALSKKIIYPFCAILMLLLCIPFAYIYNRDKGLGLKMFIGIMIGLSFYLLYTLISQFAVFSSLSVWFIQAIPFFIYGGLCAVAYFITNKRG